MLHGLLSSTGLIQNKGALLYRAIQQGDVDEVDSLLSGYIIPAYRAIRLSSDEQRTPLQLAIDTIRPSSRILLKLLEQYNAEISSNEKSTALKYAACKGYTEIVSILLNRCGNQIPSSEKQWALAGAAQYGHLATLNIMLGNDAVLALAAHEYNPALSVAQMGLNGTEEGSEERARYQAIIDRLMEIPAVAQLANEQANQENDLADIVNFAENSMQSLTKNEKALVQYLKSHYCDILKDKTWDGIRAEILSYLEFEYQLSPAIDGYHRVWMLDDKARKPGDFIPADTIGLRPDSEQCEVSWVGIDGVLHQKTVSMTDVLSIYKQLSKENYLHQESQDSILVEALINTLEIPAHPKQDEPLPLEYTQNLNKSALVAYYRHPTHNAWRYLSKSNPWMSPQTVYVETLRNGGTRAIISDADKELMSYYWIALNDTQIELEAGFTTEGNKAVFAKDIFKEINRGHNVDERAFYSEEQDAYTREEAVKTTRTDDMEADKPSCAFGVTKRLLQSEYGHPYINCPEAKGLSLEIMLDRMDSLLIKPKEIGAFFDNLFDRLKRVDIRVLKQIYQDISDILELYDYNEEDKIILDNEMMAQKQQVLTLSDEQLRSFIEKTKLWFGSERIEEHHNNNLKFTSNYHGFRARQYRSYAEFIVYCVENPLEAFSHTIYVYLKDEIKKQEEAKFITHQFNNNNNYKRKCDNDSDSDNEIDDVQKRKIKIER